MVKQLLEAGWKLNDILSSPLHYLVEVLNEKNGKGESAPKSVEEEEAQFRRAFGV